ncbi:MAG: DUF1704 domain-containing protein [Candidatus Woesearchaeota archaeon]
MATPLCVADRALSEISKTTHLLSFLTPTNLHEEEREFFASNNYEPKFTYRHFTRANVLRTRLEAINIAERTPLGQLFRNIKEGLLREIKSLENLGTEKFTNTQLYGTPSRELIRKAYEILEKIPQEPIPTKPYTATYMKAAIEKALLQHGFTGWRISIRPSVAKVAVSPSKRTIVISEKAKFSENGIKCMLAHEVGVHVLRSMNGYKQQYEIFSTDAIPGYLKTEEGLAALHEKKAGCLTNNRLRKYAGRVIAASLALKKGFRDVFNELCKFFPPKEAFAMTVRVKRGLKDTSSAGGFIKDHVYLEGKFALEEFIAKGGNTTPLYAGKIGLEHIGLVENGTILQPVHLPRF